MGGGDGRRGSGGLPSSQPHTEGGHVEERDSDANEKKAGTANVVANMTSAASAAGKITSSKVRTCLLTQTYMGSCISS
jgi:hypothetical protein